MKSTKLLDEYLLNWLLKLLGKTIKAVKKTTVLIFCWLKAEQDPETLEEGKKHILQLI